MNINASDGRYSSIGGNDKFNIGGHNFLDRAQSEAVNDRQKSEAVDTSS